VALALKETACTLTGHSDLVYSIVISRDGQILPVVVKTIQ